MKKKYGIAILVLAAAVSVGWVAYAPEHRLRRVEFATVKVDERPVRSDIYIGHPTENQAEAIALVHVPGMGDWFLDFEEEEYREASNREFIQVGRSIWTRKPMRDGHFLSPLPPQRLNEFRIHASNGQIVTVQF